MTLSVCTLKSGIFFYSLHFKWTTLHVLHCNYHFIMPGHLAEYIKIICYFIGAPAEGELVSSPHVTSGFTETSPEMSFGV